MCAILSAVTACCLISAHGQEVESFVQGLLGQYSKARLLDIYKSCFQDYMGAEHLVSDTSTVRAYLEQEMALTRAEDLPSWYYEPCGINGNYVRVSLKTVIEGLITADDLLHAFIESANRSEHPTVEQWAEQWHEIIGEIDKMNVTLPHYHEDKMFIDNLLEQGKYAISHSPEYREAYSPHYRIIRRDLLARLGL